MPSKYALIVCWALLSLACALAVETGEEPANEQRPRLSNNAPSVVLLAPGRGNTYALGTDITLYAEARDVAGQLERIEFYDNFGQTIDTIRASSPTDTLSATITWQPPNAQTHIIGAQAFRADDTASNLQEVAVTVVGENPVNDNNNTTTEEDAASTDDDPQPSTTQAIPTAETDLEVTLTGVVRADALNVRVGPSSDAGIAAQPYTSGEEIEVVGRSEDGEWFVTPLDNGSFAWVFARFVELDGDAESLPLIAAP